MKRATPAVKKTKVPVTEANMRKAAARLLRSALVSTEMMYLQRELSSSVTQEELDAKVVAVRSLPWAKIALPD